MLKLCKDTWSLEMHPNARLAFCLCPYKPQQQINEYCLFVDGSGGAKGRHDEIHHLAWALVVVRKTFEGECSFQGTLSGDTIQNPNDPMYLGLDSATSGFSEISALARAAMWAFRTKIVTAKQYA